MPALIGKGRGGLYRNRAFGAGDKFDATRGDARILVAVGRADYAPADQPPQRPPQGGTPEPVRAIKPRTYKRRDMVAEQPPVNVRIISDDEAA